MIGNELALGVIPARGGSRGVPRKNIRPLRGRPLIAWTLDAAGRSAYLDRVIVSTEDAEIAAVSRQIGADVPFMRPPELALDETSGVAPALHALEVLLGYAWVVLLQPTSPLRVAADIDACIAACVQAGAPSSVTVTASADNPYLMFNLDGRNRLAPLLGWDHTARRRQDLPPAYALNGAVYVARADWLRRSGTFVTAETVAHIMPPDRSVDIDCELDFKIVEAMPGETRE